MKFVSLFSGVGGFDIGFERAGMQCVAMCELEPQARKVLDYHWPEVPKFKDVRDVGKHNLPVFDVLCGGFPCQDVSRANVKRKGFEGERSGLWGEFARIICETKPRWIVVENVAGLLSVNDGWDFGCVLSDLAGSGYDAEWRVLRAADVGLPHLRERIFIVAYPASIGCTSPKIFLHSNYKGFTETAVGGWRARYTYSDNGKLWKVPDFEFLRMDDGVSDELDRKRYALLGNALIPQLVQWIGERILSVEAGSNG